MKFGNLALSLSGLSAFVVMGSQGVFGCSEPFQGCDDVQGCGTAATTGTGAGAGGANGSAGDSAAGGGNAGIPGDAKTYALKGSVSGLAGALTLELNGDSSITVSDNGPFEFAARLQDGAHYVVTVKEQPLTGICAVASGSGTIRGADISDVSVSCVDQSATLSNLVFSAGSLIPEFSPAILTYKLALDFATTAVTATPSARVSSSTVTIAGKQVASEKPSEPIRVPLGSTPLAIKVAASDGASQEYTVTLARAPALQNLECISPAESPAEGMFGSAVAASSEILAIGAASTTVEGAVHIYRRTSGRWQFETTLKAPQPKVGDEFGGSVAMSGDTVVIGARAVGNHAGAVYVFDKAGESWSQPKELKASNGEALDYFGSSVALDGSTLVVGAPGEDGDKNADPGSGAIYVFTRTTGSWSAPVYLRSTTKSERLGESVALKGNVLAAGAPGSGSSTQPSKGAVHIFTGSASAWNFRQALQGANTDAGDLFGSSVALNDDQLLVGAPQEDGNGTMPTSNTMVDSGAAYVFEGSGNSWNQAAYLKASEPKERAGFGTSVSAAAGVLAIGARWDSGAGEQTGRAYLFAREDGQWIEQARYSSLFAQGLGGFGFRISVTQTGVLTSAIFESSACGDANLEAKWKGAAYWAPFSVGGE